MGPVDPPMISEPLSLIAALGATVLALRDLIHGLPTVAANTRSAEAKARRTEPISGCRQTGSATEARRGGRLPEFVAERES